MLNRWLKQKSLAERGFYLPEHSLPSEERLVGIVIIIDPPSVCFTYSRID
ncbi:hypothetical protein GMES_2247 [Paraglaciecola mesophila KMM 241]|uniref:Uncharacterized protein n=1 Tax=Paraglaciecola mesophila KMM 241 TaxID=1128912 RepID=K6Z6D0_9ALTE|nr:hypothetical protein GMES_2247 [Paraglaciecola mesophila KMM 241]